DRRDRGCVPRGGPGLRPGMGGVRRPGRSGAPGARRPDLAVLPLDLRLRPRLPGHRRRPAGRRLLQPRGVLLRHRRREAGHPGGPGADPGRLAVPQGRHQARDHRPGRRRRRRPAAADPHRRRGLPVPQPARVRRRRGLRAARPGAAHRPAPAGAQAGRVLAAARTPGAGLGGPAGRQPGPGLHGHRIRPAVLGRGRPRPALVVHLVAGRARRRRAAVRLLPARADRPAGRAGVRGAGPPVCRPPRHRPDRPAPGRPPGSRAGPAGRGGPGAGGAAGAADRL
ncbi:MAG: FIG01122970: hypothetical protein, partial [uncultured Corynebacteriales bacterium]